MATRWPEAVPLRTVTATEVAEGIVSIVSRTGIPQRILTDQGSVFTSRLMKELCEVLGCDAITTSPYRPQGNGVVERLHGTLKPMLAKAREEGVDWAQFLPMALFAIRQVPNRDTGYSPHELVFGTKMRGPLDLVYAGWLEDSYQCMDVHGWVAKLQDRLKVIHDRAMVNGVEVARKRLQKANVNRSERELSEGSLVLLRVPGLVSNLEASWEGPYEVVKRLNKVNYRVRKKGSSREGKVVHISNTKVFTEREKEVCHVTVAEEDNEMRRVYGKSDRLSEEKCEGYDEKELEALVERNKPFFSERPGLCKVGECKIEVEEGSKVVNLPVRKVPYKLREKVEEEIGRMLESGVIVESDSEWCSPIVPVSKPDGSVRICIDYRQLNNITPQRRYYLPSLADIMDKAGNCAVMSTLDLTAGFHQIRMSPECEEMTTFGCPAGKFKFKRMPFGLKNAPAIFQAVVEEVLRPVSDVSVNYVDDVLVFTKTWEQHLVAVERVLRCLGEAGLTVKLRKCVWDRKQVRYLGHLVGCGQVVVPEARCEAMRQYGKPLTKKGLKTFLGALGFYRKFVPKFAQFSSALTPATYLKAPHKVRWSAEMEEAFRFLCECLCNYIVLTVPVVEDVFVLYTDASGVGIGGCLHVSRDGVELPVAFFSRQLRGAERNYSVSELEALAVVAAVYHFEVYLWGSDVTIVTDHEPNLALLGGTSKLNVRLHRFSQKLAGRVSRIVWKQGRDIPHADGLSRRNWEDHENMQDQERVKDVHSQSLLTTGEAVVTGGGDVGPNIDSSGGNIDSRVEK